MAHANCPKCGKRLRVPDSSASLIIRCTGCQSVFATKAPQSQPVPEPDGPVPTLPEHDGPVPTRDGAVPTRDRAGVGTVARYGIALAVAAVGAVLGIVIYKMAQDPPPSSESPGPAKVAAGTGSPNTGSTSGQPATSRPAPATRPVPATRPSVTLPATRPTLPPTVPSSQALLARVSPAVVRVVARDGSARAVGAGSGFFVSADGLVVTNYHVIERAEFATVLLSDNSTLFVAGIAAVDKDADLALLKVNGKRLAYLTVAGPPPPEAGVTVHAIVKAKGQAATFSKGVVSGHRGVNGSLAAIQTTAAIGRGSSGGPLIATDGQVVGVTSVYIRGGQDSTLAIPARKVRLLVRKQGTLQRLASAGGKRLDSEATDQLAKVWSAMAAKDWLAAARLLADLRPKQEDSPQVWFFLGYLHGKLGNYDIAIEHHKKAISLEPSLAAAYLEMGRCYGKLKRHADAVKAYKDAIAIKPDYFEAYLGIGLDHSAGDRHPEAVAAYKAAIAVGKRGVSPKPDFATAYYTMGLSYSKLKRYTDAVKAYKDAIAARPNFVAAHVRMGNDHLATKQYTDAIGAYKGALAIDPKCESAHCGLGIAYGRVDRLAEAVAAYKAAIALKPDYALAYYNMGVTYQRRKMYDQALAAYQHLIRLDPAGLGKAAAAHSAEIKRRMAKP